MENKMNKVNEEKIENILLSKRIDVVNEVVKGFEADEYLICNYNLWSYSEDTLRTVLPLISRAAAMPLKDWSKYSEVILSNRKLYIVGLTQHMDVVGKEVIDLNSDVEYLNIYTNNDEEVFDLKVKGKDKVQLKGDKEKLTNLYNNICKVYGKIANIKYYRDEKAKKTFGFKALIAENGLIALAGMGGIIAAILLLLF